MGIEYGPAIDMFVPTSDIYPNALNNLYSPNDLSLVIHKTACNALCTAQSVAQYFIDATPGPSTHFIVGLDGAVVQCVHLSDGAGGNCCLEAGHDTYWDMFYPRYNNLNWCTLSIEHVDQSLNNTQPMTAVQVQASHALVYWLTQKYSIPISHIKGHYTLDPISRAHCPGNYDFSALFAYLQAQGVNPNMVQQFNSVWNSVSWAYASGIYQIVKQGFLLQQYSACYPLTTELTTVDWQGDAIIYQSLSNGTHAEYANGSATIYDAYNKPLYTGHL